LGDRYTLVIADEAVRQAVAFIAEDEAWRAGRVAEVEFPQVGPALFDEYGPVAVLGEGRVEEGAGHRVALHGADDLDEVPVVMGADGAAAVEAALTKEEHVGGTEGDGGPHHDPYVQVAIEIDRGDGEWQGCCRLGGPNGFNRASLQSITHV
jgi:hypothetical protein